MADIREVANRRSVPIASVRSQKKMQADFLFLLLFLGGFYAGNAASEFYVAFGKNDLSNFRTTNLRLIISTPETDPVGYEVFSPYGYQTSGSVSPSSFASVGLDRSLMVGSGNQRNKGIRVRATDPSKSIEVRGINYRTHTADAFLALPTGPVNEEYTYIASSMLWTNRTRERHSSLILIVGTQSNTRLTITPKQYVLIPNDLRDGNITTNFVHPGQSYTVTLDAMQTYQIESKLDLTGSWIVSNKPLSVFTGHEGTDVPEKTGGYDHIIEQVPPVSTWGRFFFLVPSSQNPRTTPELYKIIASKPHTTVSITCSLLENSQHTLSYHAYFPEVGGIERFNMEIDNYCYVSSDKPVLVMQYAYGGQPNMGHGDPFMMMILPTEQYISNTTIDFYSYENFRGSIAVVILQKYVPTSDDVLLDNYPLGSDWKELHCSEGELCGYTLHMEVSNGFHSLRHINGLIPVAVNVYGYERYQSYGYPAATNLRDLEAEECGDGLVKLVDGETETEGRVEVCLGGVWGTICNDHWSHEDSNVVCGELGLLSSDATDRFYGEGEGPILLDNVECLGVESNILECDYDRHTADCSHRQDVGVSCTYYPEPIVNLGQSRPNTQHLSGYDLTLFCLVNVSPDIEDGILVVISWSKDGIEFTRNRWDTRITSTPTAVTSDGLNYNTSLSFSPLEPSDSGTYQCTAVLTNHFTGTPLANTSARTYVMAKASVPTSTNSSTSAREATAKLTGGIIAGLVVQAFVIIAVIVLLLVLMMVILRRNCHPVSLNNSPPAGDKELLASDGEM